MSSSWDNLTQDVQAVLSDGVERKANRKLSPKERKEKARQASRVRMTYDMPDWMRAEMMRISREEGCSASSIGAWMLAKGIRAYRQSGDRPAKEITDSPRFDYHIIVDESDAGL